MESALPHDIADDGVDKELDALADALASGLSYTQAGGLLGISARTVARRMSERDFAADVARRRSENLRDDAPDAALWALRMSVVVACAATSRAAPLGPVVRDIDDLARFETTVRKLRAAGFGGVQTIHPKQVPIAKAALTPTPADLARAEDLLQQADRADGGVFVDDDGRMIDEAVLRSARRLLGRD